jgi:ferrous iron transport protein A
MTPAPAILTTMRLSNLPTGAHATVERVSANSAQTSGATLERLGELGFIPGEPVQLLRRGPGGREPLAVVIGETMFALRWLEADCIEVSPA